MTMTEVVTKDMEWYSLASEQGVQARSSTLIIVAYEEPLPTISADNSRGFDSSDQNVNGWIAQVREKLYANPLVEDIFVSIEDSDVDVWVVIPERDLAVLDQLADTEWGLLEMLVSGEHPPFLIDFHVIYRCGRNIEDLAPTRSIRLTRQVQ